MKHCTPEQNKKQNKNFGWYLARNMVVRRDAAPLPPAHLASHSLSLRIAWAALCHPEDVKEEDSNDRDPALNGRVEVGRKQSEDRCFTGYQINWRSKNHHSNKEGNSDTTRGSSNAERGGGRARAHKGQREGEGERPRGEGSGGV